MSRKTIILLFLFTAVPLAVYFFMPTDKARIRKMINRGTAAIEQEDLKGVMSCVSLNYRDDYGMTYLYLRESFRRFFRRYDGIDVKYSRLRIEVDDRKATAELDVRVLAGKGGDRRYIAGSLSDPIHIVFSLEKEKLKWQVTKTEGVPTRYF